MMMNIARAVAILSAASTLPFASAFSPSSAVDAKVGAPASTSTFLQYRNHDDIYFYDVDGGRMAVVAKPIVRSAPPATSRKRIRRNVMNGDLDLYDVDSDRTSLRILLGPPAPPLVPKKNPAVLPTPHNVMNGDNRLGLYDVDSDRTSLRALLDPPAPPLIPKKNSTALLTPQDRQASLRAASKNAAPRRRASPIVSLYTIDDYNHQILHSPNNGNELCVLRFKAPWCQTCRTTNVAWERMASKLTKLSSSSLRTKIKFFSVELDGKDETTALKDALGIEGVPQGILHHPAKGIIERRVKLTRSNLSALRRNLERYCTYTRDEDGLQYGMLLDGLGE